MANDLAGFFERDTLKLKEKTIVLKIMQIYGVRRMGSKTLRITCPSIGLAD